jgi:hypothetical protein
MDINHKTLEELENDFWPESAATTGLVLKCYALRKKKLSDFNVEDLRLMIGQSISLDILVPKALDILKKNPFAEGDYFEGDLLKNLLRVPKNYWNQNPNQKHILIQLLENHKDELQGLESSTKIKKEISAAYTSFLQSE